MLTKLKRLFSRQSGPIEATIRTPQGRPSEGREPDEHESSKERVKRLVAKPLPFKAGDTLSAKRTSKRYTIKVTPQARGAIAFDERAAIEVDVLAGSKREAFNALAMAISNDPANGLSSDEKRAECGRWYDCNKAELALLRFAKNAE